jgi:hypothetical protein
MKIIILLMFSISVFAGPVMTKKSNYQDALQTYRTLKSHIENRKFGPFCDESKLFKTKIISTLEDDHNLVAFLRSLGDQDIFDYSNLILENSITDFNTVSGFLDRCSSDRFDGLLGDFKNILMNIEYFSMLYDRWISAYCQSIPKNC